LFPTAFTSAKDIERHLNQTLWLDKQSAIGGVEAVRRIVRTRQCGEQFGARLEVSRSTVKKEKTMPLIQILLALIVVGVLLWLVNSFIPMAGSIKSILNAVVVIFVVLWLLNVFGLFHSLSRIRVG
jgi:hypothetical protein